MHVRGVFFLKKAKPIARENNHYVGHKIRCDIVEKWVLAHVRSVAICRNPRKPIRKSVLADERHFVVGDEEAFVMERPSADA